MAWNNVSSVRVELAVCALTPLAVLCAVAIPGYWHVARLKAATEHQATVLASVPIIERRVALAEAVLKPYRFVNGESDRGGPLALGVGRAAEAGGVTAKSVTSEKSVVPDHPACLDYQVKLIGEGTLGAVIRMMDAVERSPARLKAGSLRMRAKGFHPKTIYDVEMTYVSRSLTVEAGAHPPPPVGGSLAALPRLQALTEEVGGAMRTDWAVPDTATIDRRKSIVKEAPIRIVPDALPEFKLNGIVRDGREPLALTDKGVFAAGDHIDGYKLIKIEADRVVVVGQQGRQEVVRLYKTEARQ